MLSFLEQSIIFGNAIDSARNIISISENESGSLVGRTTNSDGADFSKNAKAANERDKSSIKIAARQLKNDEDKNSNYAKSIKARQERTAAIKAQTKQDQYEHFSNVDQINVAGSVPTTNSMYTR